jgi:hypothetical protein
MSFLQNGTEIDADLVHNSGTIIRFKTSQLDQLPGSSCTCRIILPTGVPAECSFNCNKANPNITGPELVQYIKSILDYRTSVKVKLIEDLDHGIVTLRLPKGSGEISDIATPEDVDILAIEIDESCLAEIVNEGSFVSKEEIRTILELWIRKKNLILQGPPGTGKTWLARRLGKILTGKYAQGDQLRRDS